MADDDTTQPEQTEATVEKAEAPPKKKAAKSAKAKTKSEPKASATAPLFQAPDPSAAQAAGPAEESESKSDSEPKEEPKPKKKAEGAKRSGAKKSGGTKKKSEGGSTKDAEDSSAAPTESIDESKTSGASSEPAADDAGNRDDSGNKAESASGEAENTEEQTSSEGDDEDGDSSGAPRRRRRRGGRRRRKSGGSGGAGGSNDDSDGGDSNGANNGDDNQSDSATGDDSDTSDSSGGDESTGPSKRRRRRRRQGEGDNGGGDDPDNTVTKVRAKRSAEDEITAVTGSTRLEAKKQRRREGREAGRRRAPIVSEAEFLARREAVDRSMVIRQREDITQIGVLEDKMLVEHYVARQSQVSLIGNVYLGRVQNVLPSMEAAFIDIGKGRNAVLYAGEVNWQALGHKEGTPRAIESVLQSGQSVLVQVTKDPIGHKGARLSSQVSLAGRFLVYVPDGTTSGISRKLPDTERNRLKSLLKSIVPDTAGVIVRTAAEGASEDELINDVERLKSRWEDIEKKSKGQGPKLLYGEPDLTLKVVRDLFTEDFSSLSIEGPDAWKTVHGYVEDMAPDLAERVTRFDDPDADEEPAKGADNVFTAHRIDEQIAKALDRKVWLPSGGSLIIDRTEAMTVIDVNTGKFTGSGGNLEETVTKNNLEAAEEVVRQLRLRDIGGIIVIDFIDMVLESNRDLVLRRLVECLGRDRTRHQVAEVTSLGLVQMTRKRIGTGLLEAFSKTCDHCQGSGTVLYDVPVEPKGGGDEPKRGRRRGANSGSDSGSGRGKAKESTPVKPPSPKDVAAMAKPPNGDAAPDASAEAIETPEVEAASAGESSLPEAETTQPAATGPVEPPQPTEPEPVAEPAADQETPQEKAETPAADPAPQTGATRTTVRKRRSASRPAGTPPTSEPVAITVDEIESTPVASVPPPQVTTRTRARRSGTRRATGSSGTSAETAETAATTEEHGESE